RCKKDLQAGFDEFGVHSLSSFLCGILLDCSLLAQELKHPPFESDQFFVKRRVADNERLFSNVDCCRCFVDLFSDRLSLCNSDDALIELISCRSVSRANSQCAADDTELRKLGLGCALHLTRIVGWKTERPASCECQR